MAAVARPPLRTARHWALGPVSFRPASRRTVQAGRLFYPIPFRNSGSYWFFQGDVHVAVGAGHFFADGVGGEFNVALAEKTGHSQQLGLAQGYGFLAMRAGYFLAEVADGKLDMDAAGGAGHPYEFRGFGPSVFQPQPAHRRVAPGEQIQRR